MMSTVADLVSALAWPLAFVWFVQKYGNDVKELILRLSKVKFGNAEAEFTLGLKAAEELANAAPLLEASKDLHKEGIEFSKRMSQLERIADVSPRAAIMESWLLIEEAAGKAGFVQGASIPRINPLLFIEWLVREGKIDKSTAILVDRMRKLRNEASHLKDFELTKDEAERYLKIAVQISLLIIEPDSPIVLENE
ncbi:TPA: DUF4145 domain-containing protein [Salmonella enterica subsp. enterica serovar Typhimurium]|nr:MULTISPECIES: DUF4145 domain-containing protein [Enterobacteriaceae]MCL8913320.1 DUF4145 domain-containing protein [Salmonella enterica subsp. enterica serovar Enteritidis]MCM9318866.1 DUF4145 domain-containing protein [Salmonella enterica]MCM9908525.1 DUF4145 domain-containing protein [Salmonella enterica]MCP2900732.1 DUF4145 domain-containing protein [Salmonella enterica subsp. enterica serovar Typhimurium]MCP2909470.1 DUF4145 domain-containing protein [Salmonella enterica subsp. enterica